MVGGSLVEGSRAACRHDYPRAPVGEAQRGAVLVKPQFG